MRTDSSRYFPPSGRSRSHGLSTVLVVVAIAGLVAIGYAVHTIQKFHQTYVVEEALALRWKALKAAESVLSSGPVPSGWLGGVYLSASAIDRALKLQEGTTAIVQGIRDFEDLVVEVDSIRVHPDVGAPTVDLALRLTSAKNDLELELDAKALLGYAGSRLRDGKPAQLMASFAVILTEVTPKLTWSNFSLRATGQLGKLVTAGLINAFAQDLRFELPASEEIVLPLGDPPRPDRGPSKTITKRIPVKQTGQSIDLDVWYSNVDLKAVLNFAAPLFTKEGLWLLAGDTQFQSPTDAVPAPLTQDVVGALRAKVADMLVASPADGADAVVFLNQRPLVSLVSQLQRLEQGDRTIYGRTSGYTGKVYEQKWRDDVLGKGGIWVEPRKKDFAQFSAAIREPSVNWKANQGVQLSVTTSINASASLHWHFDPLVGGGFGDDVTITGSVEVPATGQLGLSLAEVGAKPAALMTLSMACINAPLSLETGSAIKLGARTGLRLFDSNIPPVTILDSGTQRVFFDKSKPAEATKPSNAKSDKPSILVKWAHPAALLTVRPTAATTTADGFLIVAKLDSIKPGSATPSADEEAFRRERRDALKAYASALPPPACPKPSDVHVIIAGQDFGPNNELVKFGKDVAETFNRVVKETERTLKSAEEAAKKGADVVLKPLNKLCRKFYKKC